MGIKRIDQRRFNAVGDDGLNYVLCEYTEIVESGTYDNPDLEEEGLNFYKLTDGSTVQKLNDTLFEILATGVKLSDLQEIPKNSQK